MNDLEKVLKQLKDNKARDAHGHTYELYKYGGKDLKLSMLKMFNLMKKKLKYPKIFQPANITSLWEHEGSKADLNSDRGIFNVVKIRSILDRLIYNQMYEVIESSMSCSNIGGRKMRNIRDHTFVLNAVLHEATLDKMLNLDIEIYDIMKCFDKMWASETANDIYNAGLNDDLFVLVAKSNEACQVAVKTPWGSKTQRKTLSKIEMQGGVLTPLKCSVQIDTLGKEILSSTECSKSLYKYKDCVKIPPLSYIDDCMSITVCGPDSVKMNAYVQSKADTKQARVHNTVCPCTKHLNNNSKH